MSSDSIVRGTTPTIKFKFSSVRVADIVVAYLVLKTFEREIVERDKESAEIGDDYIAWTLTQEETLRLNAGNTVKIFCDWKTADGTRGRSTIGRFDVEETGKTEVI